VPALIVHGGAGADPTEGPDELRDGIRQAVAAGWAILREGGSAVGAVEAAVCALEDHPRFNAGRGSVLTADGTVEMDASIMEGDGLTNGAVACVTGIRHPVSLARRIMEEGRHSFFAGEGARARARALGIPLCDPAELVTERQRQRLERIQAGTVGAVALDRHRRHSGQAARARRRLAAHRVRHLCREHAGRRVLHGRWGGHHSRGARSPSPGHPQGGQ
jgi:beta-aspartyl-peptidase (threonine type)